MTPQELEILEDVLYEHSFWSGDDVLPYPECGCDKWHSWDKPATSWPEHIIAVYRAALLSKKSEGLPGVER